MNKKILLILLPAAFAMMVTTSVALIALGMGLLEESEDDPALSDLDDRVTNIRLPVLDTSEENLPYKTVRYNSDALPVACPPESECENGGDCPRHCGPIGGPRRGWPLPDAYTGARLILLGSEEHTKYAIDVSATVEDGKSLADFVPVYATMEGRVVERYDQTFESKGGYGSFARVRNAQYACVPRVDMWEVHSEDLREEHSEALNLDPPLTPDEPLLYMSPAEENPELDRRVTCTACGEGSRGCVVDFFCRVSADGTDYCLRACEMPDSSIDGATTGAMCHRVYDNFREPDYPAFHTNLSGLSERNFYMGQMPDVGYGKTGAWEVLYAHMTENREEKEIDLDCYLHSLVDPDTQCGTMGSTGFHTGDGEEENLESMGSEPFVHYEIWRNINTPNIWRDLKNQKQSESESESTSTDPGPKLPMTDSHWGVVSRIEGDDHFLGNTRMPYNQDNIPGPCCPPVAVNHAALEGSSEGMVGEEGGRIYTRNEGTQDFDAVILMAPREVDKSAPQPDGPIVESEDINWANEEYHRLSVSFDLCLAGDQPFETGDLEIEVTSNAVLGEPAYFWNSIHPMTSLGENRWLIPNAFGSGREIPSEGCRMMEMSFALGSDPKAITELGVNPLRISQGETALVSFAGEGLSIEGSVDPQAIDRQREQCGFIEGIDRTGGYSREWEGEIYSDRDRPQAIPYQCPADGGDEGSCIRFFQRTMSSGEGESAQGASIYDQSEAIDMAAYFGPVAQRPQTPDIRQFDSEQGGELFEYFRQVDVDISPLTQWSQGKTVSYVPVQHISGYAGSAVIDAEQVAGKTEGEVGEEVKDLLAGHDNLIMATRYDVINGQNIITATTWKVNQSNTLEQSGLMRWGFDDDNVYFLHELPWTNLFQQPIVCNPSEENPQGTAAGMVWLGVEVFGGVHCHAYDGNYYKPQSQEEGNLGVRRNPSDIEAGIIDARWVSGHMPFVKRQMAPNPAPNGEVSNTHRVGGNTVMTINMDSENCCQTAHSGYAVPYEIQLMERGSVEMCSVQRFDAFSLTDITWPEASLVGNVEHTPKIEESPAGEMTDVYALTFSEAMPHPDDLGSLPGLAPVVSGEPSGEAIVRQRAPVQVAQEERRSVVDRAGEWIRQIRQLTTTAVAYADNHLARWIGNDQFNASLACQGSDYYQIGNEASCSRAPCCGLEDGETCDDVGNYSDVARRSAPNANACIDRGQGVKEHGADLSSRFVEGRVPLSCYEMARTGDFTRAIGYWERLWCAPNLCDIARQNGANDGQCGGSCKCGHAYGTYWNDRNPGEPVPPAAPLLDRVLTACAAPGVGAGANTICNSAQQLKASMPEVPEPTFTPEGLPSTLPAVEPPPPPEPIEVTVNKGEAYIDYDFDNEEIGTGDQVSLSFKAGNLEGNGVSVVIAAFAKDEAGNIDPSDSSRSALVYRGIQNNTIFEQNIPVTTLFSTAPFDGNFVLRFYAYQDAATDNAKGVFSDITFEVGGDIPIRGVEVTDYGNDNLVFEDVIRLSVTSGDREGESFYFAKGTGLIGKETHREQGGICAMTVAY